MERQTKNTMPPAPNDINTSTMSVQNRLANERHGTQCSLLGVNHLQIHSVIIKNTRDMLVCLKHKGFDITSFLHKAKPIH